MKCKSSLCHTRWDCKYYVVWIPKYRDKVLFGKLRMLFGEVSHELAHQRESEILEGHLCRDHVHMLIAIPPKYSVAQVVGFIKGKSTIRITREVQDRAREFVGQNFWARGCFVSTVGRDDQVIRKYIRNQEETDKRLDQLKFPI
ncbi:IS200/IS605 family transposase [Desulfovibrio sp. Huiquan2017]|uniref:IS200/IS605 family transposase n=1 Tax=Desulfovibrio sp. Huiquan2017 TaxID=2816861 RepID=UPI001A927141|nr:IS200/IS605 family transposase [Desulfovibrio sp. Huiquan2017]